MLSFSLNYHVLIQFLTHQLFLCCRNAVYFDVVAVIVCLLQRKVRSFFHGHSTSALNVHVHVPGCGQCKHECCLYAQLGRTLMNLITVAEKVYLRSWCQSHFHDSTLYDSQAHHLGLGYDFRLTWVSQKQHCSIIHGTLLQHISETWCFVSLGRINLVGIHVKRTTTEKSASGVSLLQASAPSNLR